MATIQFKRGNESDIPTLKLGEPGWAIDTNTLFVGGSSGNQEISGGGGGGLSNHEMTGEYHTASGLSAGCVVRATDTDQFGWGKLQHTDLDDATVLPNQHHNQEHGITSASDHTVSGSAYALVGLTANSTLGLLNPASMPGENEVILKTDALGAVVVERLGIIEDDENFLLNIDQIKTGSQSESNVFSAIRWNPSLSPTSESTVNSLQFLARAYGATDLSNGGIRGIEGQATYAGSDTIASATGIRGRFNASTGTVETAAAVLAAQGIIESGASVTDFALLKAERQAVSNAEITTAYGLKLESVDYGLTNYAVYTESGQNSLGDDIEFRQSASITSTGQLTLDGASGVVVNEDGDDEDFRVESTGNANMLFVDAGNNVVNIRDYDTTFSNQAGLNCGVSASSDGLHYGSWFYGKSTAVAGTQRVYAFNARTDGEHTSGQVASLYGFQAQSRNTSTGNVLEQVGGNFRLFNQSSGSVTNAYTVRIRSLDNPTGTVGTHYGFYIDNQNEATTNWSLYTNAGEVYHGDNVLIGTTTKPTGTEGQVLAFGDNGGDPTMGTNTAGIYAKDVSGTVEMFAIGEDDVATQLSSHDPATKEWIHHSVNQKTGKALRIDMERLMRRLDEEFGGGFIHEFTIDD